MAATEKWPALNIESRPIAELVPYARNPRAHSAKQVGQIARSIEKWGWTNPILIDEEGGVIAGHGRILAAEQLGLERAPCAIAEGWSEDEKRAYVIADNQLTLSGSWDQELLTTEIQDLNLAEFDLDLLGFDDKFLEGVLDDSTEPEIPGDADRFGGVEAQAVTELGDVWHLGPHRIMCGDSTDQATVAALLGDDLADVVHADPPYGMGKEADGVANDNLYNDKLDAFQMQWIELALRYAKQNAGLYVWGNAPDLWRLWYQGGLSELDELMVRNELVWAKGSGFGMSSEGAHSYPPETERCLFIMRGQQFLGNQNKDDYWDGYEPLRQWMVEQRDNMSWSNKDVNRITGTQMAGHWFSKSQFHVINRANYEKLRAAAMGIGFCATYEDLLETFGATKDGGNAHKRELAAQMRERRTYFDNAHDTMTDVWQFGRVVGDERYGHATPKPVKMLARAIRSSCPEDGLVFEPFLGTGSTLMAAHVLGRRCVGLELEPLYVDVVIRRWQENTGRAATLAASGDTFADVAHGRGV